jgi:DNA gyrase/topoisomerase IV subunit A
VDTNRGSKNKLKSNFDLLKVIVEFIEPNKELKSYEARTVISQNKVSIGEIKEELIRIEAIALRALDLVGTIIRNSKEHPVSNDIIKKFIKEEGLLDNE